MRSNKYNAVLNTSVAVFGLLWNGAAVAQNGQAAAATGSGQLDEIVVTAQKRSENVQHVPVSISAFDAKALASANVRDISDIGRLTPGLVIQRAERIVAPFLRGIGTNVTTVGFESSVAVYLDGVYFSRLPASFLSLNNVERVEVLKGPQGTLFGRNSSGGLIHVITANPSLTERKLDVSLGYGNYQTVNASAYVSVPLGEKFAASMTASVVNQGEGYGKNVTTGRKATYENNVSLRGKLLFAPADGTQIILSSYYFKSRTGNKGNTFPGTTQGFTTMPFARLDPLPGFFDQRGNLDSVAISRGYGGSLKIEQDLDFATLTSTTAYQKIDELTDLDADYTPRNEFHAVLASPVETTTQEFQLTSNTGERFKWTAGLFYFHSRAEYNPVNFDGLLFGEGLNIYGKQVATSYAAYAQGTLALTDQLNVTLGGRYTRDKINGGGRIEAIVGGSPITIVPDNPQTDKHGQFSFRVAVDYQVTPDALIYGSFSRGYKAGTFNILPFDPAPTKAEVIDAYEVGFKSELLDRRVRLNAAAFYYDISNPQVQLIRNSAILVSNAVSARVKGAEVELQIAPTTGFTLRLGAAYLDAKFKSYGSIDPLTGACVGCAPSNPQNPNAPYGTVVPAVLINASGNRMLRAPKLTASAGVNYTTETSIGELMLDVSYAYNSGFFFEPDNLIKQKSFGLLDSKIRLGLTENLAITAWGKNLTDKHYFGDVNSQSGPAGYAYIAAAPRTFGGTLEFHF